MARGCLPSACSSSTGSRNARSRDVISRSTQRKREKNMSRTLNVLVTGATGKQGGHLARELLERGRSVRALTGEPERPAEVALSPLGATAVRGDLEVRGPLERAARGGDT